MRIGFDAKRLFNNFTGLGNYSRFIITALLDNAAQHEYILYTPRLRTHPDVSAITDRDNVEVVMPSKLYKISGTTSLWRSWTLSKEASVQSLSVFHGLSQELPHNLPSGVRKVVTVHDLIFLRFPKLYNPVDVKIYKAKVSKACREADQIIAISQQTAQDLMDFLKVPPSKIAVIYQGVQPQFSQLVSADTLRVIKQKYHLPERYILNVGTIEQRKNILLAVRALSLMPESSRIPLVIVGREAAYKHEVVRQADELGVGELIKFHHHVPFSDLPAIYQAAHIFVYPSLFEGFGIPVVEAIESRIPVITSIGSCFQEAGGPATRYIDPANAEELAHQLMTVNSNDELRNKMIVEGVQYVQRFKSDKIAADLLEVYTGTK